MAAEQQLGFGRTNLDAEQLNAFRRAKRLEWVSLLVSALSVLVIMEVMGNSQAMKAAWTEDLLGLLPAAAFLVAARVAVRPPDPGHPWGYHRSVAVGHLAAAMALLVMGGFLVFDSSMTLLNREHPTIGTLRLFGHTFWLGWLMMAGLAVTAVPMVILGRMKMRLAEPLHDKVLYADAKMMKADWMTSGGAVLGLLGIGLGLWWADSVVAILIGADIFHDGISNVRNAVAGLTDATARTYDDQSAHPLVAEVTERARLEPAVHEVNVRMRDMGHVFHTEVFVVPARAISAEELLAIRDRLVDLDWKLEDLTVVPVPELPEVASQTL